MEEVESRYTEVMVSSGQVEAARALKPMYERQGLGRSILLFDGANRQRLAALGDVRTPGIADLFVAVVGNQAGAALGGQPSIRHLKLRPKLLSNCGLPRAPNPDRAAASTGPCGAASWCPVPHVSPPL